MKTIILGSDHNGVKLKSQLYSYLKSKNFNCIDLGPYSNDISVDYVDYAYQLGKIIDSGDADFGILICGTGVGMSIAVNRFNNVRGSLVHNLETASLTREHNNSNVICLGSWINDFEKTKEIINDYLNTNFGQGRHVKRIEKVTKPKVKKIVFTNGCFDILHMGHIDLLKFAKKFGDKLVVALNSDKSIKKLKGDNRPVNSQTDRKLILESLNFVDEVIVFEESDPQNIRNLVNPDVIVRGGEFTVEEIRKRDNIPTDIDIKIFPIIENKSTTGVINKIKSNGF